jgi:hypothetical protein
MEEVPNKKTISIQQEYGSAAPKNWNIGIIAHLDIKVTHPYIRNEAKHLEACDWLHQYWQ